MNPAPGSTHCLSENGLGARLLPLSLAIPLARVSDRPVENWMSPHSIDDDCSGWAQEQGGHDDDGSQDDEDNGPDIQDVLGQ